MPAPADLSVRRSGVAAGMAAGIWRTDPAPEEMVIGGVRTLFFRPAGISRASVMHLHGGAFRIGCPEQVGPFAQALAERCQVTVVCPAYRLAPEHPFPAALRDGWTVLTSMQASGSEPIIVSGDSAGGALAAGLAQCAAAAGQPLAGLILLSPWLDLTVTSPCFQDNAATDPLFSYVSARDAAALYLQGHSPQDPLASPIFADAAKFPPSFISAGAGEVLADDAIGFHNLLRKSGISSTLSLLPGMEHVAVTRSRALTGAEETFLEVCSFISSSV
jgi:monoterpene epsilon-lactone hydrolase